MAKSVLIYNKVDSIKYIYDQIDSITVEEINALSKEIFNKDSISQLVYEV